MSNEQVLLALVVDFQRQLMELRSNLQAAVAKIQDLEAEKIDVSEVEDVE